MTDNNQTALEFKNGSKINFGKDNPNNRLYGVSYFGALIDYQNRLNIFQTYILEYKRLVGTYKFEKSLTQYLRNIILNKNERFIANIILNGDKKNT